MARFGYTLYCEGTPPRDLVAQAVMAEEAGFDFAVISDHYHPWLTSQEHSAFAWSVLGAVAQATERIELATMVTCRSSATTPPSSPRWRRPSPC